MFLVAKPFSNQFVISLNNVMFMGYGLYRGMDSTHLASFDHGISRALPYVTLWYSILS